MKSLLQLCLAQIARDIKIWCEDSNGVHFHEYLYMLGPFDSLGSRQIQQLLNILAKNRQLKASYLHTLLHCGMTALDLSLCHYLVSDSVMRIVTRRCQRLSHLSIQNCNRLSTKALQELACSLVSLHSLDASGCSSCNDGILIKLGEHCKELKVLKLESCQKVTDLGINGLCGATNCPKIAEINLSGTNVTSAGVRMLFESKPYLQSLSLSTCEAVSSHGKGQFFNDSYISSGVKMLKYLDLSHTSVDDSIIANVSVSCPAVETLILIGCSHLTGACLTYIKTLENLKHLQLDATSIDCQAELTPFLKDRGHLLETLHLPASSNMETQIIAQFCHSLINLSLAEAINLSGSLYKINNKESTLFESCPHLKCLNLHNCKFSDFKSFSEHFSAIFCTAVNNLEVLNLSGVEDVEHECVSHFIESENSSRLRWLDISKCPLVTNDLVFLAVNSCQNLKFLNVSDCWKVNRSDVETANQLVRRSGRRLEIVWQ